jgi:hypothetical protein
LRVNINFVIRHNIFKPKKGGYMLSFFRTFFSDKRRSVLMLFLTMAISTALIAQQQLVPAGGNAAGTSGTISYTLGQPLLVQLNGQGVSLTGGVQQPFEISVVSGLKDPRFDQMALTVFPNPVQQKLVLSYNEVFAGPLSYALYNLQGELIVNGKVQQTNTEIIVDYLPSSTYLLRITEGSREVKTFRIIKK